MSMENVRAYLSFGILFFKVASIKLSVEFEYVVGGKSRAGHFRYFFIFSIIKSDFLHFLSS